MTPLYSITTPKGTPSPYKAKYCPEASDNAWRTRFWHFDTEPHLPFVKRPLLSMWGKEDWINDPSFADIVRASVPHAKVEVIEGSGHSIARDRPDALLALVSKFLQAQENNVQ